MRFIYRLLRSWWSGDRIRITPREGRLLRLQPPCLLRLAGAWVQVLRRRIESLPAGPLIEYDCSQGRHIWRLRVQPTQPSPTLTLLRSGKELTLAEDEVEIYPAPP